ncbi:MAG: hypothetical protein LBV44_03540 [Methylobacillus sp.]|nr:hypothetical protein [Methylobacillus sp.]
MDKTTKISEKSISEDALGDLFANFDAPCGFTKPMGFLQKYDLMFNYGAPESGIVPNNTGFPDDFSKFREHHATQAV